MPAWHKLWRNNSILEFNPWTANTCPTTNQPPESTRRKTNSTNSINLNTKLNQLLLDQIIKKIFNHIRHGARPNLSSIQILALTHLDSNHDGVTKLFVSKGRHICLTHISSVNRIDHEHLADLTKCKKLNFDATQAIRNGVLSTIDFLHSTHSVSPRSKNHPTPQGTS